MIERWAAESRFAAKNDWLDSHFSFSFGPYDDKENTRFGPMRVLNDDWIAAGRGFGAHPHSDMEVVSLVLSGHLKHQDNLGNVGETTWGGIQRMTAGTGIVHTEFNSSDTESLNLLQMWFEPSERGLPPSYQTSTFDVNGLRGHWVPVVSHGGGEQTAVIHQDMTIYLRDFDKGETASYEAGPSRNLFVFVMEGEVQVNGTTTLAKRDSARVHDESRLDLSAEKPSQVMLIDLP